MNNVFSYKYNTSYKFCHTIRLASRFKINWWEELLLPTTVVLYLINLKDRIVHVCITLD